MNLRDYQLEAIDVIKSHFKSWNTQYIELPTGSGKTVTFLSYSKEHERILIVVPTKELLNQVYESAQSFYHKSKISRKGCGYDEIPNQVHICIINSIKNKYLDILKNSNYDLLIIDEAHHVQAESYKRLIKSFDCKILGVTATPDRLDGKFIHELLGQCTYKKDVIELIECGYLCDIEGYSVKSRIDISDVDSHNSDFSLRDLYKKLCNDSRNDLIIQICKETLRDRKTLIFCINIDHSKIICKILNENGLKAAHIDGSMSNALRKSILNDFRSGNIKYLTNCQLLTEGFDEPSIDGIVLARPTKSRALFNQMIGRGLRTYKGKINCKIVDIVDNNKYAMRFNSIITEEIFEEMDTFTCVNSLKDHIAKEKIKLTEFSIVRTNIFERRRIDDFEATASMIKYLDENKINYFEPVSFDEGSFLIWMNELHGEYRKTIKC